MVKRQMPHPLHLSLDNIITSSSTRREMRQTPRILRRSASVGRRSMGSRNFSSREQNICLRRTTSFESVNVSQCVICKSKVNSSRMMKCRHTFCLQCFKNRFMISRKKDSSSICPVCNVAVINKKESKNSVSFAPLPPKIRDERCRTCGETCKNINKCKHCKRRFCDDCWLNHIDDLEDELSNINGDLETSMIRFEDRLNNFQSKANETMEFINRDIDAKISELNKKRENRIKKVEHVIASGEVSVDDIRQRMQKTQIEIKEQKEVSYDTLSDNEEKVKTFLDLQQKAAEVMAAVAIWESELNDVEAELGKVNKHGRSFIKEKTASSYKRKNCTPKIVATRDIVQRPSALAIDSWRDNIITTCPGSGQIVILDRKFKLVRRIRHQEMMAPQGVAFLQEHDEIYVTDKWKHCIFVFNHKGELVHRMCNKGFGETELCSPEGIAFHPERSVLYIADTGNNRVQILEKDGTYLDSIGPMSKNKTGTVRFRTTGPIASQLNQPSDVAVTTTRVAIADSGNHKVKVFNHDGQLLQSIGGTGMAKGLFRSPEVLKIDEKGYIIVGDAGNGRVQIFSPEGEFLRVLGAKKKQGHKFAWISGLLVTSNYNILVSDSKNNFIYLF
ncbi:tripartite motif-containing protein 2 [Monomorium pharaonis]|uniref:tripartite motif-containing protein 2 n=1 Tax=Monomorium pharaonis TaxID=307658 RepID=UPI00063EF135|nr:tripartite motif-containing protein 2 [Monomorium pharaonis]